MHPGTGLVLVGALVRQCRFREATARQPCPGWGRCSFSQEWFCLFFFCFPTYTFSGGCFTSFLLRFFPSCSPVCHLSPPHRSLLCHKLLFFAIPCQVPGCHPGWFSLIRAVTSLTWGRTSPRPPGASHGTNARAGVAMARSSWEGESFCHSRQDSSYIAAAREERALAEGRAVVLLVVQRGVLVQWVWVTVGVGHACIKQWFLSQSPRGLSDFHKLSMFKISSESCHAFKERVGEVPLSAEWKSHLPGWGRGHLSLSLLFSTVLVLVVSYKTNPGFQGTFTLQLVLSWSCCKEQVPGWFTSSKNKHSLGKAGRREGDWWVRRKK